MTKLKEYTLRVESKNGKTIWAPEKIEVFQGEKFVLKMEHKMEGGFAFHGVEIGDLKLRFQVNRNQPMQTEVKIPVDMKPGTYEIKCHFHPAHQSAQLVVKPLADLSKNIKSSIKNPIKNK
jgi:plastocyanin